MIPLPYKLLGLLLTMLALVGTVLGYGHMQFNKGDRLATARAQAVVDKQKSEAAALRAQLTQERLDNATALANLKTQLESKRETLQTANTADLHRRLTGPGLRYVAPQAAGCGRSGGSPESPAPGPASDQATAVVQLPRAISDDLWQLSADAESLKIDYGVLYEYMHNPKLVCELRQ
jgi:hypothetical protein